MEYTLEFLQEKYGEEIGTWIYETIEEMKELNGDLCIDNERYCDLEIDDISDYEDARDNGCCGFEDEEILCPINGHMFRLGFNYGH